jgi:UDP-glucose 4-epimerase
MRVLVTGGAGFIGSHLCDALVEMGNEVIILDNLVTGHEKNISQLAKKIRIVKGDIRDSKIIDALTKSVDMVFHMAASLGVKNILQNPLESISTNLHGSEVIINAALKYDTRILIASTSEIYGKNSKTPLAETDDRLIGTPQIIRWTYSDAKALEEAIAYHLFLKSNLKVTIFRLFNTVGPRQSGEYGMVFPRFVHAALNNQPLQIFGNGNQTRVFCHVRDAVEAIISLSSYQSTIGEVFNIGGKQEISIIDLANLIIKQTKSTSKLNFINYKDAYGSGYEEILRRVPDISKIKSYIGWVPKISLAKIIDDISNFRE